MKSMINKDIKIENLGNNDDDTCDLNISKICDSCGKCLELDSVDFKIIRIEGLATEEIEVDDYILQEDTLNKDENYEENDLFDVEYIEDIPSLKDEYDKKLDELLHRK